VRLLYAASERDADILYPTGFFAPDPFLCLVDGPRTIVVMSDLELDRARRESRATDVWSWTALAAEAERKNRRDKNCGATFERAGADGAADVAATCLRKLGARCALVPSTFPLGLARRLESRRLRIDVGPDPFWPEREVKRRDEVRAIEASLRAAETGLAAGIAALRETRIARDGFLMSGATRFTSEMLRSVVDAAILGKGGSPIRTICAGGDQAVDPHEIGHGPLRAHQPIVMDIFPRSLTTGYFGDLTRTVVRGRASERLKEVYALVKEGADLGFSRIRDGADGKAIHGAILDLFESRGYGTGLKSGRMQGFFHGTGHGLGLDIHEAPSISRRGSTLRSGHVVTVEPGLYYLGIGGVRLEDVALVTKTGARNLTRVPRFLEL
jgi:Xaa-Pro aminopeptidase